MPANAHPRQPKNDRPPPSTDRYAGVQAAMPKEQKELWEGLCGSAEEVFAAEEGMDAKVQALLQEARAHRSKAEFHSTEVRHLL